MKTFLESLRSATNASHSRLELHPLSMSLTSTTVTTENVIAYLARLYGIVKPLETLFAMLPEDFRNPISKTAQLEKDLMRLEIDHSRVDVIEPRALKSTLSNNEKVAGACYVLEGSVLGGKVINKHLKTHLQPEFVNRIGYFDIHGSESGPKFRSFLQVLDQFAITHNQHEIIDGAVRTFDLFYEWFDYKG
jgi:heme oxygenase (biliverdin-IX-beta and delta-forming)